MSDLLSQLKKEFEARYIATSRDLPFDGGYETYEQQEGDFKFLQWLQDLTTLAHEEDIIIDPDHRDAITYFHKTGTSPEVALGEYKEFKRRWTAIAKDLRPCDKYQYCNHHHELTEDQELVDFGTGQFVADKPLIPLLKALNELGLTTRTHNYSTEGNPHFISILLDNITDLEVQEVQEIHADRTQFNGKKELLIKWKTKQS